MNYVILVLCLLSIYLVYYSRDLISTLSKGVTISCASELQLKLEIKMNCMVIFWAGFARKSWHTSPNFILILFTSSLYLYMIWSYNLCRHIKGTFELLHKQHFAYYSNFRCHIMSEHVIIFFCFQKIWKQKRKKKRVEWNSQMNQFW